MLWPKKNELYCSRDDVAKNNKERVEFLQLFGDTKKQQTETDTKM